MIVYVEAYVFLMIAQENLSLPLDPLKRGPKDSRFSRLPITDVISGSPREAQLIQMPRISDVVPDRSSESPMKSLPAPKYPDCQECQVPSTPS